MKSETLVSQSLSASSIMINTISNLLNKGVAIAKLTLKSSFESYFPFGFFGLVAAMIEHLVCKVHIKPAYFDQLKDET